MRRKQNHGRRAKHLRRTKGTMSSIKGVSHLSRRAKRRLYCKLQLWMWRKRREKCRFAMFKGKKQTRLISPSSRTQGGRSNVVSSNPLGCDSGVLEGTPKRHDSTHKPREHGTRSETFANSAMTDAYVPTLSVTASSGAKTEAQQREITSHSRLSQTVEPLVETFPPLFKEPMTLERSQRFKVNGVLGPLSSANLDQERAANGNAVQGIISKTVHTDADLHALRNYIQEFLDDFYRFYGSFIPLQKRDVLAHLKTRFKTDFNDRYILTVKPQIPKDAIFPEVARYLTEFEQKPLPSFRLAYKKHTLTLDDLSTLADQNWLNDQVMNMYGELIMESADHQVHFLNSFFHRQLMTKGYDGVKRWTKQVDLFSKSLLLVPIHLEVHWCLVAADNARKKICLYDSQGNALQKVARNILKYLTREAKERKQTAFEHGWAVSSDEKIPQQTNENDCGVFVLEYSRCLALGKPLQFSQKDIPKIRKRIYRELCDCRLSEDG